jgi:hypothetical protein
MFKRMSRKVKSKRALIEAVRRSEILFEGLESRQLLSVSPACAGHGGGGCGGGSGSAATIEFSQAPTAVQTGLTTLATSDGFAAPTSTTTVYLANTNGVEEYTIDETATGETAQLTVNVSGSPVNAPVQSTTTFGAITNTAVTDEINAIAAALDLTAPASTATVTVETPTTGNPTYSVELTGATGTKPVTITVDSTGAPVGDETVPFSTLPTTVQNALIADAPAGVTLTPGSTQSVKVALLDGVQIYTMVFKTTGETTTVTVNSAGTLTNLPSKSTAEFSTIPTAAQTELQSLATADGYTGTISQTQTVDVFAESNGTTIYTVTLTTSSGTQTTITISSDEDGNPTVPPEDNNYGNGGGGCGGGGGYSGAVTNILHGSGSDLKVAAINIKHQ